jgi:WD40 repeat protein
LVDDGRFILDQLYTSAGGFLLIAQYSAGYIPVGEKQTRLLLEFNESGILKRMDVEKGSYNTQFGGVIPDQPPPQDLEPLGEPIPFEDVSWLSGAPVFSGAAFSPNQNLVAASDASDQIYLIDFDRRTIERISPDGFEIDGYVHSITFSPDGDSLAVLSRTIRIIDLRTRKQTLVYDGHGNAFFWQSKGASAMAYTASGAEIVSGGIEGTVKIWRVDTGHEVASWVAHEAHVTGIAVSADGAMLATSGGDGFVRLWDRETGAELGAIERAGWPVFANDGELLAIASTKHAELRRLNRDASGPSRGQTLTIGEPMDMIVLPFFNRYRWFFPYTSRFTPGGGRLLHSVGATVIWDWTARRRIPLPVPLGDAFLAFSPDGRTMATSGQDGVRLWALPVAE